MKCTLHWLLSLLGWLSFLSSVYGHGYMSSIRINDRTYVGNPFQNLAQSNANGSAVRLAPPDKGYTAVITDPDMACGLNGTASGPIAHYPIIAGDVVTMTMTLLDDIDPWPHQPCLLSAWMALCPSSPTACTNVDASTLSFFKISQDTITPDGLWPMQVLLHETAFRTDGTGAGPEYYTVVPQDLAPGNYLLRFETDCVFQLYASMVQEPDLNPSDPMFYPWCVQLNLTGTGTTIPSGVPMNTAYSPSEFSDLQNTTASIESWPVPGPPIVSLSMDAATRSFDNDPSTGYYNYNGSSWNHTTSDSNAYNDTISCSDDPMATYAFAFVGTGFSLSFGAAADRGAFTMTIDGVSLGVVGSANTVSGESPYTMQYHNYSLPLATHTVVVGQGAQNVYLCNDLVQLQGGMLPASRLPVLLTPVSPLAISPLPQGSSSTGSGSKGPNVGAIAGAVVGGVVVLILVIAGLLFLRRRRRTRNRMEAPSNAVQELPREPKMMDAEQSTLSSFITPRSAAPLLGFRSAAASPLGSMGDGTTSFTSTEPEYDGRRVMSGLHPATFERRAPAMKGANPSATPGDSHEMSRLNSNNYNTGHGRAPSAGGPSTVPPVPPRDYSRNGRPLPRPPPAASHELDGGSFFEGDWEPAAGSAETETLPPLYEHAVSRTDNSRTDRRAPETQAPDVRPPDVRAPTPRATEPSANLAGVSGWFG